MNYEFNLLHHVGVVAKRLRAAAKGRQYPFGPNGPRGKKQCPESSSLVPDIIMSCYTEINMKYFANNVTFWRRNAVSEHLKRKSCYYTATLSHHNAIYLKLRVKYLNTI